MMLGVLICVLLLGGLLSLMTGKEDRLRCRWISLLAVGVDLSWVLFYWISNREHISVLAPGAWMIDFKKEWIPQWGIDLHFALDGLSLILVTLTLFIGFLAILVSWRQITEQVRFFHFNILWVLAGLLGVFLAMDLFLFYFFWEMMLIPMFFIINNWGGENRHYAAIKFFLFTQGSGLLMLLAILALYVIHGETTGLYTFDYFELRGTSLPSEAVYWIMGGFLIAFLVKLPAVPFHTWLADAHSEAPTSGSILLAGLLLKTGAYGLLRFVLPLFPEASQAIAPYAVTCGVIGVLYGAKMAYAQRNLKRLIAFTSISHMGFIIMGVFSFQVFAYQGVVLQIIAHGITSSALFMIAGAIKERVHRLDMDSMGGFWQTMPKMGGFALLFALGSLGLPGLGNFIAEFLILSGVFQTHVVAAIFATLGLLASVIYSLKIVQKVFHGSVVNEQHRLRDFTPLDTIIMTVLAVAIVALGVFPQPIMNAVKSPPFTVKGVERYELKSESRLLRHQKQEVITLTSE